MKHSKSQEFHLLTSWCSETTEQTMHYNSLINRLQMH